MTGQEMFERVQQLALDSDVKVWVCYGDCSKEDDGIAYTGPRIVKLAQAPDTLAGYLIALHELGHILGHDTRHHRLLDAETLAWRWAIENAGFEIDGQGWWEILWRLLTYALDRRITVTPAARTLIIEAAAKAEPPEDRDLNDAAIERLCDIRDKAA